MGFALHLSAAAAEPGTHLIWSDGIRMAIPLPGEAISDAATALQSQFRGD
jgi:hypothetical protein